MGSTKTEDRQENNPIAFVVQLQQRRINVLTKAETPCSNNGVVNFITHRE